MTTSKEVRLKSRPVGEPTAANFEVASVDLPAPGPGEVQVRNSWMTVDPYMRGRMNDAQSYVPPFQLGEAMQGGAVGEVVASNDAAFKAGDLVQSFFGWREAFNAPAAAVQKLDTHGLPPQAFLGVAGMPGLTAYVGLLKIAALKDGDVVFVSAAAGAVGQVVCQIAKLKGHKVIGSVGGPEKVAYLKSLGIDEVIDYKAEKDLTAALTRAAPGGIDVYFENVGGAHMEAALMAAKPVRTLRPVRDDQPVQRHRHGAWRARPDHGGRQAAAPGGLHRFQPRRHAGRLHPRHVRLDRRGQGQVARDGGRGHRERPGRLPQTVQGRELRQDAGQAELGGRVRRYSSSRQSGGRAGGRGLINASSPA